MLLDPGSGCASPLSIDGVAFCVSTWSTSRFSTVQVGQTVLDRYRLNEGHSHSSEIFPGATMINTGPDLYLFLAGLLWVIFSCTTAAEFAGWSSCQAQQPKIVFIFLAGISCDNVCTRWALK